MTDSLPRLGDYTTDLDMHQKSTAFVSLAICSDSFFSDDRLRSFRARGHGRYVKSGIDPLLSDDTAVASQPLASAFVGLVDRQSVLGKLLALGAVSFPLNGGARLQVGSVVASEVPEAEIKPIARLDFTVAGPPTKVSASIVISAEAFRSFDLATQNGIRAVLVAAVAAATDVTLVNVLTAGSPVGSATVADVFAACSGGSPNRPALIAGLDVLLGLAPGVVRDLQSLGIAILPTPAASGVLIALDCAGLLVGDGGVEIATARDANVLLDDGSGSPASTSTVNLWMQNLAALRAERFLRLAVRADAVAFASVVGSPA